MRLIISLLIILIASQLNGSSATPARDALAKELRNQRRIGEQSGCYHNGTIFGNGSVVPSVEPCLLCKCVEKSLKCGLRICPQQLVPPPRNCILVHRKNFCCPYLLCTKYHNGPESLYGNNDQRIIDYNINNNHNKKRPDDDDGPEQRIIHENSLFRRLDDNIDDYDENDINGIYGNDNVCVSNGTIYKSGSAMSSSTLCSYCFCIKGHQKCIQPKCVLPTSKDCEPIFADSACCPIRYDCNQKHKTDENRISGNYHNYLANKHYLRTRQRSKGCLVGKQFHPDGHKLPHNKNQPCDMCYCIRGERVCTPKKCAPVIKNCMPIIPNGECCPISYDCANGTSRETQNSMPRQLNLLSYFFGTETNTTESEDDDDDMEVDDTAPTIDSLNMDSTTKHKGLLDALREGLDYIDSSNDNMESALSGTVMPLEGQIPQDRKPVPDRFIPMPNQMPTAIPSIEDDDDDISLFDLLLGKDSLITHSNDKDQTTSMMTVTSTIETSTQSNIKYEQPTDKTLSKLETLAKITTDKNLKIGSKIDVTTIRPSPTSTKRTTIKPKTTIPVTTTNRPSVKIAQPAAQKLSTPTPISRKTTTIKPSKSPTLTKTTTPTTQPKIGTKYSTEYSLHTVSENKTVSTKVKPTKHYANLNSASMNSTVSNIRQQEKTTLAPEINLPTMNHSTLKINISNGMKHEQEINHETVEENSNLVSKKGNLSNFFTDTLNNVELPLVTTTDFMLTNSTKKPVIYKEKLSESIVIEKGNKRKPMVPLIDAKNDNKTLVYNKTSVLSNNNRLNGVTPIPSVINSNPSILETDYNLDYNEPTLPPSLPNLKIIPFLPTDAVKYNRNPTDFYSESDSVYPSITTSIPDEILLGEGELITSDKGDPSIQPNDYNINLHAGISMGGGGNQDTSNQIVDKIDQSYQISTRSKLPVINNKLSSYETKDVIYPSITEPSFDIHDDTDSIDKSDKYLPESDDDYTGFGSIELNKNHDKQIQNSSYAHLTITSLNHFSPPNRTEGGFIPHDPIKLTDGGYYVNDDGYLSYVREDSSTESNNSANLSNISLTTMIPMIVNESVYQPNKNNPENVENVSFTTTTNQPSSVGQTNGPSNSLLMINHSGETDDETDPLDDNDKDSFGFMDNLLGMLFRSREKTTTTISPYMVIETKQDNHTVELNTPPPFKTISASSVSIMDLIRNTSMNTSNNKMDHNMNRVKPTEQLNNKTDGNLQILRDVLLATVGNQNNDKTIVTEPKVPHFSPYQYSGGQHQKLYHHQKHTLNTNDDNVGYPRPHGDENFKPIRSDLSFIIGTETSSKDTIGSKQTNTNNDNYTPDNYQVIKGPTNLSNNDLYVVNPVDLNKLKQHTAEGTAEVDIKPSRNKLNDPSSILKLAGCNIYSNIYSVGRIISELSGPCLSCMCTEIGVRCTPLDC